MKRCGQWLFVLWVAAALLCPQAATAVSRASIEAPQLVRRQVQSLPLIADLSFKETVKVEAEPGSTPDKIEQIGSEPASHISVPTCVTQRPQIVTPVQPVIEAVRGRLPFVCGPPGQN